MYNCGFHWLSGKEFMVISCSQVRANEIGKYLLFCVSDVYLSSEYFGLFCICSRSQICCGFSCAGQSLLLNQIVLDISSVGRSTYTYKSVNCVNVNSGGNSGGAGGRPPPHHP